MKIFTDYYLHIFISLFLFTLSLFFPAIHYVIDGYEEPSYYHSSVFLLLGWFSVLTGYEYSWLANISYLFGLIFFMNPIKSCFLGILTLALALSSLLIQEEFMIPYVWGLVSITKYDIGFYLWVMSFFTFALGQTYLAIACVRKN